MIFDLYSFLGLGKNSAAGHTGGDLGFPGGGLGDGTEAMMFAKNEFQTSKQNYLSLERELFCLELALRNPCLGF